MQSATAMSAAKLRNRGERRPTLLEPKQTNREKAPRAFHRGASMMRARREQEAL